MLLRRWLAVHPELLLFAGVMLLIGSSVLAVVFAWWQRQLSGQVRHDQQAVIEAATLYYKEYGRWPAPVGFIYHEDQRFGRAVPNTAMFNILRAVDGEGNIDDEANRESIAFLNIESARKNRSGLDLKGQFVDPWGSPYQIVLDTDLDGACDVQYSIYGHHANTGILVWSCGPDRLSDTGDDLLSW